MAPGRRNGGDGRRRDLRGRRHRAAVAASALQRDLAGRERSRSGPVRLDHEHQLLWPRHHLRGTDRRGVADRGCTPTTHGRSLAARGRGLLFGAHRVLSHGHPGSSGYRPVDRARRHSRRGSDHRVRLRPRLVLGTRVVAASSRSWASPPWDWSCWASRSWPCRRYWASPSGSAWWASSAGSSSPPVRFDDGE